MVWVFMEKIAKTSANTLVKKALCKVYTVDSGNSKLGFVY